MASVYGLDVERLHDSESAIAAGPSEIGVLEVSLGDNGKSLERVRGTDCQVRGGVATTVKYNYWTRGECNGTRGNGC